VRDRATSHLAPLLRLLIVNGAFGALVGCSAAAGLLLTDAGGLATLIGEAGTGTQVAASALLFGGFALTFASLAMGSAIMLLPKR